MADSMDDVIAFLGDANHTFEKHGPPTNFGLRQFLVTKLDEIISRAQSIRTLLVTEDSRETLIDNLVEREPKRCQICGEPFKATDEKAEMFDPNAEAWVEPAPSYICHAQCGLDKGYQVA